MSTRIFSAALLLLLATACREPAPEPTAPLATREAGGAVVAATANDRVPCALGGGTAFAAACALERKVQADGTVLTIRHPDGGFRRLLVTRDGSGIVAADGAEVATITPLQQGAIEVALGRDRYRLPISP